MAELEGPVPDPCLPDPFGGLPAALRHGVEQTVAAQCLEGWHPTARQLRALAELVCERTAFGDYLAGYRADYPVPAATKRRSRWLPHRHRPYLIPGTNLLRNNFGATSQSMLADLEYVASAGRLAQWHRRIAAGADPAHLDIREIHQQLFGDVYPWAGQFRITELRRGDTVFALQGSVRDEMDRVEGGARRLAARGGGLDTAALGYEMARLYAEYNQVHPFREGNGRTGTTMLHTVAALCGRRFDLAGVSRTEWYAASRDSMPFRRAGRPGHRPFLPLMAKALR